MKNRAVTSSFAKIDFLMSLMVDSACELGMPKLF